MVYSIIDINNTVLEGIEWVLGLRLALLKILFKVNWIVRMCLVIGKYKKKVKRKLIFLCLIGNKFF